MRDMVASNFDDFAAVNRRIHFVSTFQQRLWTMQLTFEQTFAIIKQMVYFQRTTQISRLRNAANAKREWNIENITRRSI